MGTTWTYVVKQDKSGTVVKRKARMVGQGFSLIPGVHITECHAAAVCSKSLRSNIAMGVVRGMYIWQADYTSAYLNAPNEIKILMEQPEGYKVISLDGYLPCKDKVQIPNPYGPVYKVTAYAHAGGEAHKVVDDPGYFTPPQSQDNLDLVAVLDKSLYGVGDSGRNWFKTLNKSMTKLGYYQSRADQCVRARLVDGKLMVTCTYTDDITGMSDTEEGYRKAVKELGEDFNIKDLGELRSVIGLDIKRDWENGTIYISQEAYIK